MLVKTEESDQSTKTYVTKGSSGQGEDPALREELNESQELQSEELKHAQLKKKRL